MDPKLQEYLRNKYSVGMSEDEKALMSDSDARANQTALGTGMMEAADTIAAGLANRQKNGPLLGQPQTQSNETVRAYIMDKLAQRRGQAAEEYDAAQEEARIARETERENQRNLKEEARHKERMGIDRARMAQEMAAKQKTEKEAQNLKPTDIAAISEGQDAKNLLTNLEGKMRGQSDSMGPVLGRLKTWNPWDTETQVLQSDVKAAAQMIGKYLEGGVLRAEDVPKYEAMLPTMKDTPEVAQGKIENVRKLLEMKQNSRLDALEAQGYSVAGFRAPGPTIQNQESPKAESMTAYAAEKDVADYAKKHGISYEQAAQIKASRGRK